MSRLDTLPDDVLNLIQDLVPYSHQPIRLIQARWRGYRTRNPLSRGIRGVIGRLVKSLLGYRTPTRERLLPARVNGRVRAPTSVGQVIQDVWNIPYGG